MILLRLKCTYTTKIRQALNSFAERTLRTIPQFQMIIPSLVKIFGSQETNAAFTKGDHYMIRYKISRTKKISLNLPSEPCSNSISPNTSYCIAKWIQDKIGCTMNLHGTGILDELPHCKTESQVMQLGQILSKLKFADAKIVYEQTGCMAGCEKHIYGKLEQTQRSSPFSLRSCKKMNIPCTLGVTLWIPHAEITYPGTKQYVVYDFSSFIADVGGYMGLLLGFSALSLYNELENLLKRWSLCSSPQ